MAEQDSVWTRNNFQNFKLLKQVCIVGVWFSMGLMLEIIGPTLPDLRTQIDVSYEEMSRALFGKAAGFFIGSVAGGILHEICYKYTDLLIALGIFILMAAGAVIPWVNNPPLMALMLCLTGVGEGFINTGGNTMTMHLWGKASASPMNAVHFGFGLGAILAPQLAIPFLSPDVKSGNSEFTTSANSTFNPTETTTNINLNTTTFYPDSEAQLVYPYTIIALIGLLFTVMMVVFYMIGPPKGFPVRKPVKSTVIFSPSSCAGGRFLYGLILFILLFAYFIQAVGGERAYGKFLFTYAVDSELQFSKRSAATLNSLFWACFVSGRFSGIIISRFLRVPWLIACDIVGNIVTTVLLAIFALESSTALWVLTAPMGFFISLMFPAGMSWANLCLEMTSVGTMVLLMGAATGGMIYQYFPGYLFLRYGVESLMYVMVGFAILNLVVFTIMQLIARTRGDRFSHRWSDNQQPEVSEMDDKDVTKSLT